MQKTYLLLLVALLIFSNLSAGINSAAFTLMEPTDVIRGDKARIEIMQNGTDNAFNEIMLFYRELGQQEYKSTLMKKQGFLYTGEFSTKDFTAGQVEYYIAYQGPFGTIGTLPEEMAQFNPYLLTVNAGRGAEQTTEYDITIISPEQDDILASDEVVVAASFYGAETEIDFTQTQLLIDGVNVTARAEFEEGLVTLVPKIMPVGRHNVELKLFNSSGDLVANQEWSFRTTENLTAPGAVIYRGSAFVENRSQNISSVSNSYNRFGTDVGGTYGNLEFHGRLLFSSEESDKIQPVNRYMAQLRYNFAERYNLYLNAGDFVPYYNPIVFQDKRVRGVQTGFQVGFFAFDFVTGETKRGVDGLQTITATDTTTVNGTYKESITTFRPGFRFGEAVQWNLNFVNAKEDDGSIDFGGNVRESVSLGTDLRITADNARIMLDASVQASIKNTDAGGPELDWDELVEVNEDLEGNAEAEQAFDFLKSSGLLSVTAGLNPLPSLAMQVDLRLRYFKNFIKVTYLNIHSEYASPGNPYMLKDISGIYVSDNIRMLDNQVFLNLFYRGYKNNISEDELSTTNNELGATISYYPLSDLPSLTLGYSSFSRQNDVTPADSVRNLFMEDNSTQRVSLSTSYQVNFANLNNTLLLSFSNYQREDPANPINQSDFNMFTFGVRTKYKFPMSTNLSFSTSESNFGIDAAKTNTKVQRFNVGADYRHQELALEKDMLRPFVNLSFQNIEYSTVSEAQTRNTYSAGIMYQTLDYGALTLRYDQINYSNINDTIFNARYEYLF